MSLRDQLLAIHEAHEQLTPRLVVDTARDPAHPLHSRFEWDDAVAGPKYREQQAAELIRSVRITFVTPADEDRDVRAFHAVGGRSYEPVEQIAADPVAREVLLRQAAREWRAMRRRYEHLAEFVSMVRADVAPESEAS